MNKRVDAESSPGITLNRLTKWSVPQTQLVTVELIAAEDSRPVQHEAASETVCRLELDMNSVPRDTSIPVDMLGPLFEELQVVGARIANEGLKAW
jgi:hypothetical protein